MALLSVTIAGTRIFSFSVNPGLVSVVCLFAPFVINCCKPVRYRVDFHKVDRPVRSRGLQLAGRASCSARPTVFASGCNSRARCNTWHPNSFVSLIPWSNGEDACVTCRRVLVRFQPGSLTVCSIRSISANEYPDGSSERRVARYWFAGAAC